MKADSGALKLNIVSVNFIKFARDVFEKFTLAADKKNIYYNFKSDFEELNLPIDSYYMEIVLTICCPMQLSLLIKTEKC